MSVDERPSHSFPYKYRAVKCISRGVAATQTCINRHDVSTARVE